MTNYNVSRTLYDVPVSGDLSALKATDGTTIVSAPGAGCTLGVGTYYFPFGAVDAQVPSETSLIGSEIMWAAAVAATITLELCNFPADITDWANSVAWVQENPSAAIVSVNGSGNSATALTITAGGSAAGAATCSLGNMGLRRARWKVVTTVGGVVRVNVHGKQGS